MKLFEELKYRGLINDVTSPDIEEALNNGGITFYIGVDPTGDSLHIGHYSSVIVMCKRLLDGGHKPIIIAGGGTGLIGDPKQSSERPMISKESALYNIECIKKQIDSLLKTDVKIVNNADWLVGMDAIDYLRDYGKFFNVNYMLSKETVKKRLDIGITYTEFSYMILQSIDFLKLYEKYGCTMQIGGQDQWGNITSGLELIRKMHGSDVKCYGLTMPLITRADGTKFGKSESGESLWIDKTKTSPYEMYQYFINVEDEVVIEYLKKLTFISVDEIEALSVSVKNEPEKRLAQKTLAFEVVKFVHGDEEASKARKTSEEVFSKGYSEEGMEEREALSENILDILVEVKISSSKSEARRLLEQGGISINNEKITDINTIINKDKFKEGYVILSKGKKTHVKVNLVK
jgi:tyrosyl-tRNA synthetase